MSTDYITRDKTIASRIQALCWKDGKTIGEALNIALGAHGFELLAKDAAEAATAVLKAQLAEAERTRDEWVNSWTVDTERLRADVSDLTRERDGLREKYNGASDEVAKLRDELSAAQRQLAEVTRERDEALTEIKAAQRYEELYHITRRDAETSQIEVFELRSELAEASKTIATNQANALEYMTKVEAELGACKQHVNDKSAASEKTSEKTDELFLSMSNQIEAALTERDAAIARLDHDKHRAALRTICCTSPRVESGQTFREWAKDIARAALDHDQ